jgi:hypothetical protein
MSVLRFIFLSILLLSHFAMADHLTDCGKNVASLTVKKELTAAPLKLIQVGEDSLELMQNQHAISGRFIATLESAKVPGGYYSFVDLTVYSSEKTYRIKMGDYVYFISPTRKILAYGRVDNTHGIEHLVGVRNTADVKAIADQSHSVVIIRSN